MQTAAAPHSMVAQTPVTTGHVQTTTHSHRVPQGGVTPIHSVVTAATAVGQWSTVNTTKSGLVNGQGTVNGPVNGQPVNASSKTAVTANPSLPFTNPSKEQHSFTVSIVFLHIYPAERAPLSPG